MPLPPCPHRPPCPGCPRYGHAGPAPPALERLSDLARDAAIPLPEVRIGAPRGFRLRARLSVRGRSRSPKVGIFQAGSHRIVDMPSCLVHHPKINEAAAALKDAIRETGTSPYADRPHVGVLRTVQVVVERATERVQIVLVANDSDPGSLEPLAEALRARLGDRVHSLWWNGNPHRTNVLLGDRWHRWHGPEAVCERIGGAEIFFPPGAFGQSHLGLADRLVETVHGWVGDGERVAELYAGCGAIGVGLLPRVRSLAQNELAPDSLRGLELSLARRSEAERARSTVYPGPAADALAALSDADTVIVDPPRRGLDTEVLEALCRTPPRRLVYVSCGLESFLAQTERLTRDSRLSLRAVEAFDLFPYTEHVETAALFE